MRRLAVIVALVCVSSIARADLRFAIGNDVFTEASPVGSDDNGFTNDLELHFWRAYRGYRVGARFVDRWITEETMAGGRRRDLVAGLATVERTWGTPAVREVTPALRLGPTVTGNLAGRWMQNAFHTACGCGRRLDEGLQDTYEGGNAAGVAIGGRVRGSAGTRLAQAYAFTDGQLALGTGLSAFEAAGGGALTASHGRDRFGGHVELAVLRVRLADDRLALPGAYRGGWQAAWRAGLHYARGRVRADFEYRANESGSGQPMGVVALTFKQAGGAF